MTTKEQQTIDALLKSITDLRSENQKFREDVTKQVSSINEKTDKKHLPVYLEQDILKSAQQAISEAINKVMTSYDSPVSKLIKSVVDESSNELRTIISD